MRDIVSDLLLAVAVLVGAGLLLVGASDLPPPRFEPMGSAALPRILACMLVLFALVLGARAIRRYFVGRSASLQTENRSGDADIRNSNVTAHSPDTVSTGNATTGNAIRAAILFAGLVAYVFALDKLQWPFILATTVFVTFVGTLLSQLNYRSLIVFLIFGLALSISVHTVFTRFLYVDLG